MAHIYCGKNKKDNLNMNIVEFTEPNFGMYKNDVVFQHTKR